MCRVRLELIAPTRISGTADVAEVTEGYDYGKPGVGKSLTLLWPSGNEEAYVVDCNQGTCPEHDVLHLVTAYFSNGRLCQFDFAIDIGERFDVGDRFRCRTAINADPTCRDGFGDSIEELCDGLEEFFTCLESERESLLKELEYGKVIRSEPLKKALDKVFC